MPEHKVKDNKDKKPVRVPEHLADPYNPGNIHLSKAQFIEQEKKRKERDIKVNEYKKQLEAEAEKKVDQKEAEIKTEQNKKPKLVKEEKKPKGRPRKID